MLHQHPLAMSDSEIFYRSPHGVLPYLQMKEDQASDFILSLRQERETSIPLGIDPALLLAAKRGKGPLSANFLVACIATMMLPLKQCAVIAANGAVMRVCRFVPLKESSFCCPPFSDSKHGSHCHHVRLSCAHVTVSASECNNLLLVVQAAKEAGVISAAVPPPLSARGTYPHADYSFDGFGPGGGITWRRMESLLTKIST